MRLHFKRFILSAACATGLTSIPAVAQALPQAGTANGVTQVPSGAVPADPTKAGAVPMPNTTEQKQTEPGAASTPANSSSVATDARPNRSTNVASDMRYRIGAGDVLEIRISERPTLSRDSVRVDASGVIRMPMIRHDIPVLCRTESEVSDDIAKEYAQYLKDPQVSVFVKEFNAQPVSLAGAVQKPGGYQLQRRIRLRELLMIAGGPGSTAGGMVQITHDDSAGVCDTGDPNHRMLSIYVPEVTMLKLDDVMRASPDLNPFVRPGDFINLPEANQAYVVGNVYKPTSIALNGSITISRAIAMAGGALPNSKSRVRLLRLTPDSNGSRELFLPLKSVQRDVHEDIALQAGDIVEVPLAEGKLILKSMLTTVAAGALLSYPLTIIR